MINFLDEKLTKKVTIGEYKFNIAINRKMAADAFSKYPKYWECLSKSEEFEKAKNVIKDKSIASKNQPYDVNEVVEELIDDIDTKEIAKYILLEADLQESGFEIVNYLFPKMLEFGNNEHLKENGNYEAYAEEILQFCYDNNILFNYYDNENIEHKGVSNAFMDFITQGFIVGGKKKKNTAVNVIIE